MRGVHRVDRLPAMDDVPGDRHRRTGIAVATSSRRSSLAFGRSGRVQIELIQPIDGEGVTHDFLAEYGPGAHHLAFLVDSVDKEVAAADDDGIDCVMSGHIGTLYYVYLDTFDDPRHLHRGRRRPRRPRRAAHPVSSGDRVRTTERRRTCIPWLPESVPARQSDVARRRLTGIAGALAHTRLFSLCSTRELRKVAKVAKIRTIAKGTRLMTEGEDGDTMFVIVAGVARVSRNGRKVAQLGAGDAVGELALLGRAKRNATVDADTDLASRRAQPALAEQLVSDVPSFS